MPYRCSAAEAEQGPRILRAKTFGYLLAALPHRTRQYSSASYIYREFCKVLERRHLRLCNLKLQAHVKVIAAFGEISARRSPACPKREGLGGYQICLQIPGLNLPARAQAGTVWTSSPTMLSCAFLSL